ncbi:MAG: glycosyltransferase family 39 protein [Planctomycetaceae bacterium]|nr:glycosyltransferase family 39 protein [Planctomycetaceae bacterium]
MAQLSSEPSHRRLDAHRRWEGARADLETGHPRARAAVETPDAEIARRQAQATWALVALGVAVRLVRYLPSWPLWGDEAFVAASLLDRGFLDLLRPLEYHQVAPLLFLWLELSAVKLFGFNELALRLAPMIAGVASVFVFQRLASRVVQGVPHLLAVGIFAVAYYPVRHAAEVKPYSTDLFASLVLTTLAVEWLVRGKNSWALWALAGVAPLALALSHPSVFVAGGIALALLPVVYQRGELRSWLAYLAYGMALVGTFLLVFVVFTARQYAAESGAGGMGDYWASAFPPLTQPVALVGWLLDTHTGVMLAYPVGGKNGGSALTAICIAVAVGTLWRQRRWALGGVLLAPLGLAFVAASLHRYPYGGSARVMLYMAPAFCLLMGIGGATLIAWGRNVQHRRLAVAASVMLLAALGVGQLVQGMVAPYKTFWDGQTQGFARWFWRDLAHDAELVCVRTDLGKDFFPQQWEWGRSAVYLCNQRIYSSRHRAGAAPQWDRISATHPLRCVVYSVHNCPRDDAKLDGWLAEMETQWRFVGKQQYRVAPGVANFDDVYDVYEFVPYPGAASSPPTRSTSRQAAMTNPCTPWVR